MILVFFAGMAAISSCEGPVGPAGPTGPDGVAGITGAEGPAGSNGIGVEVCQSCHNDETNVIARILQWEQSLHATGGHYERNTSECAVCHTHEGFVECVAAGTRETSATINNPTPIGCRTCHNIHKDFDAATDFNLTTTAAVTLDIDDQTTIDLGESNLCVNCHQPRVADASLTLASTEDVTITSSYWGPHYGVQSVMLTGTGGYKIGDIAYDLGNTHAATKCTICHMATTAGGAQAGGHSFSMTYPSYGSEADNIAGCVGCHSTISDFDKNDVQTDVAGKIAELKAKLIEHGLIDEGDHVPIPYGSSMVFTAEQAKVYYNYKMLIADGSNGVHNAKYIKSLLDNSLAIANGW